MFRGWRGCGCLGHPAFPAPSFLLRDDVCAQFGRYPRRESADVSLAIASQRGAHSRDPLAGKTGSNGP
jgi:hypothetical protein